MSTYYLHICIRIDPSSANAGPWLPIFQPVPCHHSTSGQIGSKWPFMSAAVLHNATDKKRIGRKPIASSSVQDEQKARQLPHRYHLTRAGKGFRFATLTHIFTKPKDEWLTKVPGKFSKHFYNCQFYLNKTLKNFLQVLHKSINLCPFQRFSTRFFAIFILLQQLWKPHLWRFQV